MTLGKVVSRNCGEIISKELQRRNLAHVSTGELVGMGAQHLEEAVDDPLFSVLTAGVCRI